MDDAVESQTTSPQSIEVTDTFLERFEILSCEEQLSLLGQCISVHSVSVFTAKLITTWTCQMISFNFVCQQ